MQPLRKKAISLRKSIINSMVQFELEEKQKKLIDIDTQLLDSNVWANVERAQNLIKASANLRTQIEPWLTLEIQISDIIEMMELDDEELLAEFEKQFYIIEESYNKLRKNLLFSNPLDQRTAIVKLSAGVGGLDAQDWTQILERMYLRWAEKNNIEVNLIEKSKSDEAGVKSVSYEMSGNFAYGRLKSEHGVHRLVRLSPFNSDNLRQTSFALVEILPEIETPEEVEIDPSDLRIDVYRAGGHGGQSVNTTDSAVRITHVPTNTVVAIQNERSQIQNKETAMKVLKSRLLQIKLEQRANDISELRAGESANWGSQIRNYVMHPYTLVKDTRTKVEVRDVNSVLDGDIDIFIEAFLEKES